MKRFGLLATLAAGIWTTSVAWGVPPRDFNDDGTIDLADFAVFQRQFTGPTCIPSVLISDLDGSGCVDLTDYAAMAAVFAGGIPACDQVFACGIPDPASGANAAVATCKGRQFRQTTCSNPAASAVDKRLCKLGVVMDGDASEGLSLGQSCAALPNTPPPLAPSFFRPQDRGVGFVDNFKDSTDPGVGPGPFGTNDQALCPDIQGPSGFNIGCSVLWFAPDDDPADGQDSSFLYVAWDLGDKGLDGSALSRIPVPFDVDANASSCSQFSDDDSYPFKEFTQPEEYSLGLRSCAALSQYDSRLKVPLDNLDELSALLRLAAGEGLRSEFRVDDVIGVGIPPVTPEALYFPTADAVTDPTDGCVERELEVCRGHCTTAGNKGKCSGSGAVCSTDGNCPPGERCLGDACTTGSTCPAGSTCDIAVDNATHSSTITSRNANNVELVIKKIETSGFMGPHTGRVCSGSGKACRTNADCPPPQTCNALAIAPDSTKALENRLAMAQLVASLFADADADGGTCGSEELASVALRVPIPGLEVKKEIRCAEQGSRSFTKTVDALVDSFVEFQVTVENVGNEDLNVRLSDVLTEAQIGSLANCSTACGTCNVSGEPCVTNADCPAGQVCNGQAFLTAALISPSRAATPRTCIGTNTACTSNADCGGDVCGIPVTNASAGGLNLTGAFFERGSCNAPDSFLKSVKDNEGNPGNPTSALLGTLRGRTATQGKMCSRTGLPCNVSADCPSTNGLSSGNQVCVPACGLETGDQLVLRFSAKVGEVSGAFCDPVNRKSPDCENTIAATGVQTAGAKACTTDADCASLSPAQFCITGTGFCGVRDQATVIDTSAEKQSAADDNAVSLNLLCRDITFSKLVGFPGNDLSFVNGEDSLSVPSVPPGGFVDIEYVYSLDNVGEVTESVAIFDARLCADVAATAAAVPGGISFVSCPICQPPGGTPVGQVGPVNVTPAQPPLTSSCRIRFSKQDALRHFLRRDQRCVGGNNNGLNCLSDNECPNGVCEEDPACDLEEPLPPEKRDDCYRNCALASADATALELICRPPTDQLLARSFTTICNTQCTVDVKKEVRCLPDCDPAQLPLNEGYVSDPAKLKVVPGACVQYRITATNINAEDVGICAMSFKDTMKDDGLFTAGPTDVKMLGKVCTNLDFAGAFNWDGNDVVCKFNQILQKGKSVTVLFRAIVGNSAGDVDMPVNNIQVLAAGENDCPAGTAPPVFSCSDKASVGIDIDHCDLQVRKEVTCDDPKSPSAMFEPDGNADALPGAKLGFRISIENTGEVAITSLQLEDTMTCNWTVNGIAAHIGGTDVSACVCAGGVCGSLASISGVKDLVPCVPGGLGVGETLVITYEATVDPNFNTPDTTEDCKDTIIVSKGEPDVCMGPQSDACPERMAMVTVNVEVPDVACDKLVCVDQDNNGDCDEEFPFAHDVNVPGTLTEFPATVIWKFQASNPGEIALANAEVCDAVLVADLLHPIVGMSVGACPILATGCADLGPIPPGGAAVMGTCSVRFETSDAWLEFAGLDDDGRAFCHTNTTTVTGEADPTGLCDRGADPTVAGDGCRARVCMEPPFVPTVSTWGMVILALSLLTLAKVHQRGGRRQQA